MSNYNQPINYFEYPFRQVTRKEATSFFAQFQEHIPARIEALEHAVRQTKIDESDGWKATLLPESLDKLGEWFVRQVDIMPLSDDMKAEMERLRQNESSIVQLMIDRQPPWILTAQTFQITIDVGIYLGETLKKRRSSLYWKLETTNTVDFQRPVLAGFKKYLVCQPIDLIHGFALRIANGNKTSLGIRELFDVWVGLS